MLTLSITRTLGDDVVQGCQVPLEHRVDFELQGFFTRMLGAKWVEHEDQRMYLFSQLKSVIDRGVPGAILELGCKGGEETSVNIRRLIDHFAPNRSYHVYDSFEGLPERVDLDGHRGRGDDDNKGGMKVGIAKFKDNFKHAKLTLPDGIHKGFFANISDSEYPSPVAFAFFDGDMYSSITDSFQKVYHKLSPGAVVVVHDYMERGRFEGPKKAIENFLADKPEKVQECYNIMAKIEKARRYV